MKYFLLGAFSTGFVVYGTALIFGATGTTSLSGIFAAASNGTPSLLLTIGAALLLVGFGFKVAAVPFHMWTPDVYQGSPTAVTAFMSSGAKIAGFAALLRVFATAFPSLSADMTNILWVLAALTMIVGNITAISQIQYQAYAGLFQHCTCGLHPDGLCAVWKFKIVIAHDSIAAGLFYLVTYAVDQLWRMGSCDCP